MKNKTIWLENIKFAKPNELNENKEIDVLIIGGGITGLSTAYHLMNKGLKVCLVEKNLIAHAITSRTTGKLTFLQESIYSKLKDKSKLYYKSQKGAIKLVEDIIKANNIDCNYEKVKSYIYTNLESEIAKIKKEEEILKKLNIKYKKESKIPFNVDCKYAISVDNTAVFHPIKYLIKLREICIKNNIEIFENTRIKKITKKNNIFICNTDKYIIKAKQVVIASHYPFFLYPYFIPLKTYLEKSYVSASQVDETKPFSAITISKPVESIRFHKDCNKYIIYLNGTHNLCNKYNNKNNFDELVSRLKELNLKTKYIWSNHDIMTEDNLPYIGFIDGNLLIGTGYNTWGMTNGSLAGKIISDLILGKETEYKELFDPKRNGKNIAIYTDSNNKEHIVYNICPHMKCSLIFNEIEKTWDCPCHGSRFDIDGKSICGLSNNDISFKE